MLLARVSEGIGDFVPEMLEHGYIPTVSWKSKCALKNKQTKTFSPTQFMNIPRVYFDC